MKGDTLIEREFESWYAALPQAVQQRASRRDLWLGFLGGAEWGVRCIGAEVARIFWADAVWHKDDEPPLDFDPSREVAQRKEGA